MPGTIEFEIKGAEAFERVLIQLGPRVAKRLGGTAVRAAGRLVRDEAKALAPADTGNLRRSIIVVTPRGTRAQYQRTALVGYSKAPVADERRKSGVDVVSRRAHLTEFGTAHSAARPHLRPAMARKAPEALNVMGRVLGDGIEREAGKLARGGG